MKTPETFEELRTLHEDPSRGKARKTQKTRNSYFNTHIGKYTALSVSKSQLISESRPEGLENPEILLIPGQRDPDKPHSQARWETTCIITSIRDAHALLRRIREEFAGRNPKHAQFVRWLDQQEKNRTRARSAIQEATQDEEQEDTP